MIPRAAFRMAVFLTPALSVLAAGAAAADIWVKSTAADVVSTNDCGSILSSRGAARIRRSFQPADSGGGEVNAADRLNSGDELITLSGGRIEAAGGDNVILVLGENSRVRLVTLISFTDPAGMPATRLDVELLAGEARVQVRLNEESPAHLLASLGDVDILVSRGDAALSTTGGWRGAVLSGDASGRIRRGQMAGAPFPIPAGRMAGGGESVLDAATRSGILSRLPFSFESYRFALPPMPLMSSDSDAP